MHFIEHLFLGLEKDTLLLRNAELSQKFEGYKRDSADHMVELRSTIKSQQTAISGLEQSIQDMQEEITQQDQKVTREINNNNRDYYTAFI